MSDAPPLIDSWLLAARIAGQSEASWSVVIPPDQSETVVEPFRAQLASLIGRDVPLLRVGNAEELVDVLGSIGVSAPAIVLGLDALDASAWRHLDANRSRLQREGHVIAVVAEPSASLMAEKAPNFWSWVGGSVWRLAADHGA